MTLVHKPSPVAESLTESTLWDVLPSMAVMLSDDGQVLRSNRAFDRYLSRVSTIAARIEHKCEWLNEESCPSLQRALAQCQDFRLLVYPRGECGPDDVPPCFECEARWLPVGAIYSCVLHDVARAHHTAQSLEAQAQQFRLLANNVPVLIAYYDAINFTCQFANSQYACTFGWDENSIIGRTFAEIIGEEAAAQIQPQVNRVLQERKGVSYERQLPTEGGRHQTHRSQFVASLGQPRGSRWRLCPDLRHHSTSFGRTSAAGIRRTFGQVHAGQRRRHRFSSERGGDRRQPPAFASSWVMS